MATRFTTRLLNRILGRRAEPFDPRSIPLAPKRIPGVRRPPVARKAFDPRAIPLAPARKPAFDPRAIPRAPERPAPVLRPPAGRRPAVRGRRAPISAKNLEPFLRFTHGQVIETISVTSTWVARIHLVMWGDQPALAVTFKSGFTALYPATTFRTFNRMRGSASKGKFVWAALYHDRAYISFVV